MLKVSQEILQVIMQTINPNQNDIKIKKFSKNWNIFHPQTIEYHARGKIIQTEKRALAVLVRGKIRPGDKDEWQGDSLYVPPLPPTNLRGCHLIKISYDVFFVIEPKSLEKEIKVQLPIVLATYPFRSNTNGSDIAHTWPEAVLKPDTHYPSTLPIFRPWLHEKTESTWFLPNFNNLI